MDASERRMSTKLARIAVDIPPGADAAFGINVSKMRVLVPAELRPDLKAIASAVANRAQAAYRQTDGGPAPGGGARGSRRGSGAASRGASPTPVRRRTAPAPVQTSSFPGA